MRRTLIEKIILLAKDKGLREELGRNARELVMKEQVWEERGEEIIGIYDALIRGGQSQQEKEGDE